MGFFGGSGNSNQNDHDEKEGQRLLQFANRTFAELEQLDGAAQHAAMSGFLELIEDLSSKMAEWSSEERIRLGLTLQDEAIGAFRHNRAIGYALWLAGAWLESGARTSRSAYQAHELLSGFASYVQKTLPEAELPPLHKAINEKHNQRTTSMGILDFLGNATYQRIGKTQLMMLFQEGEYFSNMHRGNFERYVRWRGLEMSEHLAHRAFSKARLRPEMTFAEFIDRFLETG